MQLSSHQTNAELAALRQDLEDALQNVDDAIKERDVARDLAASFVKDDKAIALHPQQVNQKCSSVFTAPGGNRLNSCSQLLDLALGSVLQDSALLRIHFAIVSCLCQMLQL